MLTMRFSQVLAKTGPPRGGCRETDEVPASRGACWSNASCLDVCVTRGFSLVEVLLAIGILSIGLTMVASAFPFGLYQTQLAVDSTNAALAAQSVASLLQARVERIVAAGLGASSTSAKRIDGSRGIALGGEDGFDNSGDCFVYNPYRRTYASGAIDWSKSDPSDYRVYVWLRSMTTDPDVGPWKALLIVCRSGESSDNLAYTERANGNWTILGSKAVATHFETTTRLAGRTRGGSKTPVVGQWTFRNVAGVYYTIIAP